MGPVFSQVYQQAWVPYSQGQMDFQQFLSAAEKPVGDWMLKQVKPEN